MKKPRLITFELCWGIKQYLGMLSNTARRAIVNRLLGKSLILQKYKTPQGYQVELIDLKRRLPYGKWNATDISEKEIKLKR